MTLPTTMLAKARGVRRVSTDYPTEWEDFIGQDEAVEQICTAIGSARARRVRMDHMLLASGIHGVGKTTLAKLSAHHLGVGLTEVSGAIKVDDARRVLNG